VESQDARDEQPAPEWIELDEFFSRLARDWTGGDEHLECVRLSRRCGEQRCRSALLSMQGVERWLGDMKELAVLLDSTVSISARAADWRGLYRFSSKHRHELMSYGDALRLLVSLSEAKTIAPAARTPSETLDGPRFRL
jgi:hypothetical protein